MDVDVVDILYTKYCQTQLNNYLLTSFFLFCAFGCRGYFIGLFSAPYLFRFLKLKLCKFEANNSVHHCNIINAVDIVV